MNEEEQEWYDDFYYLDSFDDELTDSEKYAVDCATDCICGAWGWSPDGKPVHIADCICGAG